MSASSTSFAPPYAEWNTPRLDNITRLLDYCKTLQSPADFSRQQWAVQGVAAIGQAVPTSATTLTALRQHLTTLVEVLLDHLIRHSADVHPLLDEQQNQLIVDQLRLTLPSQAPCLFDAILQRWDENLEGFYERPVTTLADARQSAVISDLVTRIQRSLQWYGPDASEAESPILWVKLLCHSLALALDPDSNLLGFEFDTARHTGMTIAEIFSAFDDHLLTRNALILPSHLPLARYVLRPRLPAAFQVSDLPTEMVYRSSTSWVHFLSAVNLSEMLTPGGAARRSSTEILLLPEQLSKCNAAQFDTLFQSAVSQPVLEWAQANGKIPEQPAQLFPETQLKEAYSAFNAHQAQLITTVEALTKPMPVRFDMAKEQLQKYQVDPYTPCYRWWPSQEFNGAYTWETNRSREAWEVYASGDLDTWSPENKADMHAWGMPDVSGKFDSEFNAWLATVDAALQWQLENLLKELPRSELRFIEQADVELFQLRKASGGTVAFDETAGIQHLIGRAGLLIRATKAGVRRCYELFPQAGVLVRRGDLDFNVGGVINYPPPAHGNPLGSNSHSGWHRGVTEPLDLNAYENIATPRAGHKSSVIITRFALIGGHGLSRRDLIERIATEAIKKHLLATSETLRENARGTTDKEQPHWTHRIFKAIIPFWQATEDIIRGVKESKPGLVRQGIGYGLLDLLMIGAPIKSIGSVARISFKQAAAIALRITIEGMNSGLRAAFIRARLSVSKMAPIFTRLAVHTSVEVANQTIPLFGLVLMTLKAGPKVLKLSKRGFQELHRALRTVRKTLSSIQYPGGLTRVKTGVSGSYQGKLTGDQLRHVGGHRQVVTRTIDSDPGQPSGSFLVDLHSAKPYGPKLVEIDDYGTLALRAPTSLPVQLNKAGVHVVEAPHELSMKWVLWGDDLYLQSKDLLYIRAVKPGGAVTLRQVNASTLLRQKPLTGHPMCRSRRDGRSRSLCLLGSGAFPDTHTNGRDIVPWFNDRTLTTQNYKYVFNNTQWQLHGARSVAKAKNLRYEHYKETIQVEVLGGNELFKAIRINGGILGNFDESHTLSAVLAPRRADGLTFLVTRADPDVFYSGRWSPGDGSVMLTKFRPSHPIAVSPNENDTLALIYTGSYDAHVKIQEMGQVELAAQLTKTTQHLANYRGLPQFEAFINGHFNMGTTPAQAALFCHYTQMRMGQTTRAASALWQRVTSATAATDVDDIVLHLNRILSPGRSYNAQSVLQTRVVRRIAGEKNLAYLKLTFNTDPVTTSVYYSLSGRANHDFSTKLAQFMRGKDLPAYRGWQRQGEVAISDDGIRYIDAQPTRRQIRARKQTFSIPDTSTPRKFIEGSPNPRALDSEHNLLEKLKSDGIDFETITSAVLYSKLPVCPSCIEVLHKLQSLMLKGSLRVFEGLPSRQ